MPAVLGAVAVVTLFVLVIIVGYCLRWTHYWWRARTREKPSVAVPPAEIHVRFVTVGTAPETLQEAVDTVPDAFGTPSVLSERPLDIDGATVYVVPESFSATAARGKARAMEWGRRHRSPESEYVLYLDEDTMLPAFDGIPDADIVQLRRRPQGSESALVDLMEVHRAGILFKELGYGEVPFHSWGGGLAVRRTVEDAVTWDRDTIGEDTAFVWEAVAAGHSHRTIDVRCSNQAPPSIRSAVVQRRRWSTMLWETHRLPPSARVSVSAQLLAWAVLPLLLPASVAGFGLAVIESSFWPLAGLALAAIGYNIAWSYLGWRIVDADLPELVVLLAGGFFLATIVNFVGRTWGTLLPPTEWVVTEKH